MAKTVDKLDKSIQTTLDLSDYATVNHGTHVTYSITSPKVAGTASTGTENAVARGDHVHAVQTSVSGNAGSATKLATARNIIIGNKTNSFNGTASITYTLSDIGAAATSHTHNYAGSSSAGGAANSATKLATARTITIGNKANSFDGSANITFALNDIGAAASSHGTHVSYGGNGSATTVSRSDHTHSNYATTTTTGALSSLQTSAKGSLVAAINEVFQNANNGKQLIANAIGNSSITANSTFNAMSEAILELRNNSGLDIISATALPATGKENQICVITNNPEGSFLITNIQSDTNSDGFLVFNTTNTSITPISITNGNVTQNYRITYVKQGTQYLATYIWSNGAWNVLTNANLILLDGGTLKNTDISGGFNTGTYHKLTSSYLNIITDTNDVYNTRASFKKQIDFTYYNTLKITLKSSNSSNLALRLYSGPACASSRPSGQSGSNVITINSTSSKLTSTLDISSWKGLGCLNLEAGHSAYVAGIYVYYIELY